jgi:hypothetical protein
VSEKARKSTVAEVERNDVAREAAAREAFAAPKGEARPAEAGVDVGFSRYSRREGAYLNHAYLDCPPGLATHPANPIQREKS